MAQTSKLKLRQMKVLVAALICFFFVATGRAEPRPPPSPTPTGKVGRLIVQRTPNFGSDLSIRLLIDGKRVADVQRNQHYGGILSAGRHVVTALALPNTESRRPTSFVVTVKSGQVYIFTATWESDRLVLRPSNLYMPTTRANRN
jgi:hypothetical protein